MASFGPKTALAVVLSTCSCTTNMLVDCDYVADELCVAARGFNVTPESISWEIQTVETNVNLFFPGLDLVSLIGKNAVQVEYMTEKQALEADMANDRGMYYAGAELIRIKITENLDAQNECVETYYVLGHELLHFVAANYLGYLSTDHNVDYLFIEPSIEKRGVANDNAEFFINVATERYCKALAANSTAT